MKRIAILRGINVGGKRKILMQDLREMFTKLGFTDICTYIQSGNVVFSGIQEKDEPVLEQKIEKAILETFQFEVPVIVRSEDEWNEVVNGNPFLINTNTEIEKLYVSFLQKCPETTELEAMKKNDYSPEKYEIIGKNIFGYFPKNYSKSKLSNQLFEKKLKVTATTRNWKTVLKLQELIGKI